MYILISKNVASTSCYVLTHIYLSHAFALTSVPLRLPLASGPPESIRPVMPVPSPQTSDAALLALSSFSTTSPSRRQALYSDFSRQKHSNPPAYQSNIEWWRKALQGIVSSGLQTGTQSRLVLKADQSLLERVRIDGTGKPLALRAVIVRFKFRSKEFLQTSLA